MRLLIATSSYPVEDNPSAGIFVQRNVDALADRDVQCTVIRPGPAVGLQKQKVIEVPIRKGSAGSFLNEGFPEAFIKAPVSASRDLIRCVIGMTKAIRQNRDGVDAVIAHWALPAGMASLLATRSLPKNAPPYPKLIIWLHSSDVHAMERIPGGKYLARSLSRNADFILAVSRNLADRFEKLTGNTSRPVRVLHPGASCGPTPLPPPPGPFRAIFLGRLEPIKGVTSMIAVAEANPDWTFTIAGKGSLLSQMEHAARTLTNLNINPGIAPDAVRQELSEHHLLILPGSRSLLKRSEGLPTVLLEALDAGRPVIAPDSGGIKELITEKEGYVVPPGATNSVTEALRHYELHSAQWRQAAPSLHAKAAKYSAPRAAEKIYGMLKI